MDLTITDVILLQQAVDEVFSKAHFNPLELRGEHGRWAKSDVLRPGFHKATKADYDRVGKPGSKGGKTTTSANVYPALQALQWADDPTADLQFHAIRIDANGDRVSVYGYHHTHDEAADKEKFERLDRIIPKLDQFDRELPKMLRPKAVWSRAGRTGKTTDVKSEGPGSMVWDTAGAIMLMRQTGMRAGEVREKQRGAKASFGVVKMQRKMVTLNLAKKTFSLEVPSKSGKTFELIDIQDPKLFDIFHKAINASKARGEPDTARLFPGTNENLTKEMLRGIFEDDTIINHDMRLAAATTKAWELFKKSPAPSNFENWGQVEQHWRDIVAQVATLLNDTPKVAESRYIDPGIRELFEEKYAKVPKPKGGISKPVRQATRTRNAPAAGRAKGTATGVRGAKKATTSTVRGRPRQQGPGTRGKTPVKAPTLPRNRAASTQGTQTLQGRKRKAEAKIEEIENDIEMYDEMAAAARTNQDPAQTHWIDVGRRKKAELVEMTSQLSRINTELGLPPAHNSRRLSKIQPDGNRDLTTNTPIGVVDMRLVVARKRKKKMDRQAILNKIYFDHLDRLEKSTPGRAYALRRLAATKRANAQRIARGEQPVVEGKRVSRGSLEGGPQSATEAKERLKKPKAKASGKFARFSTAQLKRMAQ